ncbi:hypothetical protein COCMIDRAFT_86494 [Bipolaris oryzae ATCC 44560]|uniref:Uncharacterized protein n=1 Tax=Bipolaris oryzae ATCC 44560 TaxID=930090 RepID=W6ZYJ0_COCMI|nr:uncharacterized protein COCMIDRAFT_86494 [Bipolaris oryzae ATCC 44560]EUC48726.1 hypothetical protein COCMIDRAFT_86494 [Bipolaris oryzae ATCC 44560]
MYAVTPHSPTPCNSRLPTHTTFPIRGARAPFWPPHPISETQQKCKRCNMHLYCIQHATWLTGRYEKAHQAHLCHRSCTSEFEM